MSQENRTRANLPGNRQCVGIVTSPWTRQKLDVVCKWSDTLEVHPRPPVNHRDRTRPLVSWVQDIWSHPPRRMVWGRRPAVTEPVWNRGVWSRCMVHDTVHPSVSHQRQCQSIHNEHRGGTSGECPSRRHSHHVYIVCSPSVWVVTGGEL